MTDLTVMSSHKDLAAAYEGSYYFIAGAGGDLEEWMSGYEGLLKEQEIGKPTRWLATNGAAVNPFASEKKGGMIEDRDQFPSNLSCLLFPLDDLHIGRLVVFKIKMEDRWFDDVIHNMRVVS